MLDFNNDLGLVAYAFVLNCEEQSFQRNQPSLLLVFPLQWMVICPSAHPAVEWLFSEPYGEITTTGTLAAELDHHDKNMPERTSDFEQKSALGKIFLHLSPRATHSKALPSKKETYKRGRGKINDLVNINEIVP